MVAFGDDAQAHAVASLARTDLRAGSVFLLVDRRSLFTRALARFFRERFVARGGTVVGQRPMRPASAPSRPQSPAFAACRRPPDVLFFSALPSEVGRLTRQFRAAGLTQPILSGDGFDTPLVGRLAGELADEVYYSTHVALDSAAPRRACGASSPRTGSGIGVGSKTPSPLSATTRCASSPMPSAVRVQQSPAPSATRSPLREASRW
jgi:ABC-type branched-subunit amino acid transport system substrate-binding protein